MIKAEGASGSFDRVTPGMHRFIAIPSGYYKDEDIVD